MRRIAVLVAVTGAALMAAPGAYAFDCSVLLDNFNRPNAANLGPNWALQNLNIGIVNNAAVNANSDTALATFNPRTATEACIDVSAGAPGTQYAAIVLRYANNANNVFIKVQDNDGDGAFERLYWYYGNNGSPWPSGRVSDLLTPFLQGRLHVAVKGTRVVAHIDTNFDNKPEQGFVAQNLPTASLGMQFGIAGYGGARIDNFATAPPQTKITKHPAKTTASRTARFKFKSTILGSKFRCKLDGQKFKRCSSPKTYRDLGVGKHTFRVRAIDPFGNPDPTPAKWVWRITA
ncbi:MAG TPA: hypothetical protein VK915_05500 [Gaiellaceae bacterium]|nr:hypothetical protein [Gaiellaceae bacterium]